MLDNNKGRKGVLYKGALTFAISITVTEILESSVPRFVFQCEGFELAMA